MRVAVAGAGSAAGRCAVPWLERSGHEVVDLGRTMRSLLDVRRMSDLMRGCDVALHLTPPEPQGFTVAAWSRDWRLHDLTRTVGVQRLLEAARPLARAVVKSGVFGPRPG